jgi:hypothetical protein
MVSRIYKGINRQTFRRSATKRAENAKTTFKDRGCPLDEASCKKFLERAQDLMNTTQVENYRKNLDERTTFYALFFVM